MLGWVFPVALGTSLSSGVAVADAQATRASHGTLPGIWVDPAPVATAQWSTSCEDSTPRLERLASAIEHGDVDYVRRTLEEGADVNETWRDTPLQVCRSLLLRSIWYGQQHIFRLLLDRGAESRTLPRESLVIAVRDGRLDLVRTLFALGLRPLDNNEIVIAGLQSKNVEMLELLLSSGVSMNASNVPASYLTDDITRFLVPKYLKPNDESGIGGGDCVVAKLLGYFRDNWDGCDAAVGPLWFNFVIDGRHSMVEFMIEQGAHLSAHGEAYTPSRALTFTAMDLAVKRKDKRMMEILRRAGASAPRTSGAV